MINLFIVSYLFTDISSSDLLEIIGSINTQTRLRHYCLIIYFSLIFHLGFSEVFSEVISGVISDLGFLLAFGFLLGFGFLLLWGFGFFLPPLFLSGVLIFLTGRSVTVAATAR